MSLSLQQNDTPLIKVNAADSCGSSGYDVKRHTDDDGKMSTGSAFDPTTIRRTSSQDEALFQQVARPIPMTQLQTDFIAKTMLEIRKSYAASSSSNIGHHKRQKTETMANNNKNSNRFNNNTDDFDTGDNNNNEDESLYSHEGYYGGSTSSDDDDHEDDDDDDDLVSLSSLALPRPSFDIMNELETHHKTIQFVASAGGLITHWNEAFAIMMNKSKYFPSSSSFSIKSYDTIGSSGNSSSHGHGHHHPPLTIFDLVDSHSLPLLYSMIAMSLHNVPIVEVELFRPCDHHYNNCYSDDYYNTSSIDVPKKTTTKQSSNKTISSSSSSHMSITLPCKALYNSSLLYNITIVLLPAVAASQQCFLGILTPITPPSTPIPATTTTTTTPMPATSRPIRVTEHKEKEEEVVVAMMVSKQQQQQQQQQHYCHDEPCRPYYPKFLACGKVLSIDDKFLCQLLLGSK